MADKRSSKEKGFVEKHHIEEGLWIDRIEEMMIFVVHEQAMNRYISSRGHDAKRGY